MIQQHHQGEENQNCKNGNDSRIRNDQCNKIATTTTTNISRSIRSRNRYFVLLASLLTVYLLVTTNIIIVDAVASQQQNQKQQPVVVRNQQLRTTNNVRKRRTLQQSNTDDVILCRTTIIESIISSSNSVFNQLSQIEHAYKAQYNIQPKQQQQPKQKQEIACIPIINNEETDDIIMPFHIPEELLNAHTKDMESGGLIIAISNAQFIYNTIQTTVIGIEVTNETSYEVYMDNYLRSASRSSLTVKPNMTVAFVMISTNDTSPTFTKEELIENNFNATGINFMNQYKACSFGKLQYKLAEPMGGVIEVTVPNSIKAYNTGSGSEIINAATNILSEEPYNISKVSAIADKIIFCVPPGTGDWAASAGVRHWRVQMNDVWCMSLAGLIHELGHTVGQLHSRDINIDPNDPYSDRTGYMGSGTTSKTGPLKCFNGYENYLWDWYNDKQLTISDPLRSGSLLIDLVAFVDYDILTRNNIDEPVLINIVNKYFIQYNCNKKFNSGTEMHQNQVTITTPYSGGSTIIAALSPGEQYILDNNYMKSGQKLIIDVCGKQDSNNNDNDDRDIDKMIISIALDQSNCNSILGNVIDSNSNNNSNNQEINNIATLLAGQRGSDNDNDNKKEGKSLMHNTDDDSATTTTTSTSTAATTTNSNTAAADGSRSGEPPGPVESVFLSSLVQTLGHNND